MREAVLNSSLNWADLENSLALLLRSLMRGTLEEIPFVIYFAPSNTETRIKIVDAVFEHLIFDGVDSALLEKCFKKILEKIHRVKDSRNKIVHGQIVTVGRALKQEVRLTGTLFDVSRLRKSLDKQNGRPQLHGMSVNDVKTISEKIHECRSLVDDFAGIIDLIGRCERPTLHGKVLQLALRLSIEAPQ